MKYLRSRPRRSPRSVSSSFRLALECFENRTLLSATAAYLDGIVSPTSATSVASADLNFDSKPDYAIGRSDGTVGLYLGDSNGNSTSAGTVNLGNGGKAIDAIVAGNFQTTAAASDEADLAAVAANKLYVLKGEGNGTGFDVEAPVDLSPYLSSGTKAVSITSAQLFGTGQADLAILASDGKILLFKGKGNQGFTFEGSPAAGLVAGSGPFVGIVASSFNQRDLNPTLSTVDVNGVVTVLVGDGHGNFSRRQAIDTHPSIPVVGLAANQPPSSSPSQVNDQSLYLLLTSSNVVTLDSSPSGSISFSLLYQSLYLPDPVAIASVSPVSASGVPALQRPYLVAAGAETVANIVSDSNQGNGIRLAQENMLSGSRTVASGVGVFDDSGNLSVVTSDADNSIRIETGDGKGGYRDASASAELSEPAKSIAVDSLNGSVDSNNDIAFIDNDGNLNVLFGDGHDGFTSTTPTFVASIPNAMSVLTGKFFGQAAEEIAVLDSGGKISLYRSKGDGTFETLAPIAGPTTGIYAVSMTAFEFKPGQIGLAVSDGNYGNVIAYEGTSPSQMQIYATPDGLGIATGEVSIVAGHFYGQTSGYDDLAVVDSRRNVTLLKNDGGGSFTKAAGTVPFDPPGFGFRASGYPLNMIVGDFDQDGRDDLACLSGETAPRISILLGNGKGGFVNSSEIPTPAIGDPLRLLSGIDPAGRTDLIASGTLAYTTFLATEAPARIASIQTPATLEGDPQGESLSDNLTTPFAFIVTLDSIPLRGTFTYKTGDGTAKAGTDYQALSSTADFSLSESSNVLTISVSVNTDFLVNGNRTFLLDLSSAQGINLNGFNQATQTIYDDDSEVVNTAIDTDETYHPISPSVEPVPLISLAKAIDVANAMNAAFDTAAGETITFDIPTTGTGPIRIVPPSQGLPGITGKTFIDGTTQSGTGSNFPIQIGYLDPPTAGNPYDSGLTLSYRVPGQTGHSTTAAGSRIQGLDIIGFQGIGLIVDTGPGSSIKDEPIVISGNVIEGNGFSGAVLSAPGLIFSANIVKNNREDGIQVSAKTRLEENSISGNNDMGIVFNLGSDGSSSNYDLVNSNNATGIDIDAPMITIQSDSVNENRLQGISVDVDAVGAEIDNVTIQASGQSGLLIAKSAGPESSASGARIYRLTSQDNTGDGITIERAYNTLLWDDVVKSNGGAGIFLNQAVGTRVIGADVEASIVGIRLSGASKSVLGAPAPSNETNSQLFDVYGSDVGIWIENGSTGNVVENASRILGDTDGVRITGSASNRIGAPRIGNAPSNAIIGTTDAGIKIEAGSSNNVVLGNLIENSDVGIRMVGSGGNTIGALSTADPALGTGLSNTITGNTEFGMLLVGGSDLNYILGNAISRNGNANLVILGSNRNQVLGNAVGAASIKDSAGVAHPENYGIILRGGATGNVIGYADGTLGDTLRRGNVIRGNTGQGILITEGASGNTVFNATIDASSGIRLIGASNNTIGQVGSTGSPGTGFGNTITDVSAAGIALTGSSNGNEVDGNKITVGSNGNGIMIDQSNSNVILGNAVQGGYTGIRLTAASMNSIGRFNGTSNPGTGLGNTVTGAADVGLVLAVGSTSNYVDRNLISGNVNANLTIAGSNANQVYGNWIGTDAAGRKAFAKPGNIGIVLRQRSTGNRIGSDTATPGTGLGNVISGNTGDGILVVEQASGNLIAGNVIGRDAAGTTAVPNYNGVEFSGAPADQLGDPATQKRNLILGNRNRAIVQR